MERISKLAIGLRPADVKARQRYLEIAKRINDISVDIRELKKRRDLKDCRWRQTWVDSLLTANEKKKGDCEESLNESNVWSHEWHSCRWTQYSDAEKTEWLLFSRKWVIAYALSTVTLKMKGHKKSQIQWTTSESAGSMLLGSWIPNGRYVERHSWSHVFWKRLGFLQIKSESLQRRLLT